MPDDAIPMLSESTLAALFGEALKVGAQAAPMEPPDWWQDPEFSFVPVTFIGRGGSGFVWKASRRDGHGFTALKLVPFRTDPIRLRQRWEDECASLQKVRHPNLVAYLDHGLAPDGLSGWLAMEWIEGTSLEHRLARGGPLPLKEIKPLVPQAVAGLAALHEAGFVHRDIKPSNLLLESASGRLVVADFGIAHNLTGDPDIRVTRTEERPLTPGYSPPELLESAYQPTPAGDQYSLAFTFWQLLTGTLPLGAFAKLHHLCRAPESLNPVLRRALSPHPGQRYPTLPAFGQAFAKAANRPSRRHLLPVLALLLTSIAALYWFNRPSPFPKRFQTGDLPVDPPRLQWVTVDVTVQKNGVLSGTIRVRSDDPFYGCTPGLNVAFRDRHGEVIHAFRHRCFGVNGTWLVGHPSDRTENWRTEIPPEVADRVHTIDFTVTRDGVDFIERNSFNIIKIRESIDAYKATLRHGFGK